MTGIIFGSLARIADLEDVPFDVDRIDKKMWETGDYALGKVTGTPTRLYKIEKCAGDMIRVFPGDRVVGALGERTATLEGVGSWKDVECGRMHALTSAGIFGAFTSIAPYLPNPLSLDYCGHITRDGRKVRMNDFALTSAETKFSVPTILLVGTSMSAGKTTTGKLVCKVLSSAGLKVIGAKLTGAGRYRDVASFGRAGAAEIYDFVDVGLPSTVVPEDVYREAIRPLIRFIETRKPDFLVAEAGASPLEPYNGATMIDELRDNICCTILCASDPYAVVGVQKAFDLKPDLVAGPATNTSAAIDLVTKLTGVRAINVIDRDASQVMREFLEKKLTISLSSAHASA
ncbi:MAG: hypothetical protein OER97_08705 [Gammaproteobacteria bacterium]|nr:hypothetical protein [Gammaproteobacteria bacterium]